MPPSRCQRCVPDWTAHPPACLHPRPPAVPYPILNKLPFPLGFLGFVVLGFVVVLSTFQMGKLVKGLVSSGSSGGSEARSDGEPPVSGPAAGEAGEKKKER